MLCLVVIEETDDLNVNGCWIGKALTLMLIIFVVVDVFEYVFAKKRAPPTSIRRIFGVRNAILLLAKDLPVSLLVFLLRILVDVALFVIISAFIVHCVVLCCDVLYCVVLNWKDDKKNSENILCELVDAP